MKTTMEQRKLNSLRYKCNDVIITFKIVPTKSSVQKYSFSVDGDKDLTKKLRDSVKNKTVTFESIPYCSAALFEIIEKNSFSVLISRDEQVRLFKAFVEKFKTEPVFETEDIGKLNAPQFRVTVTNPDSLQSTTKEGRTVDEASALVLKQILGPPA